MALKNIDETVKKILNDYAVHCEKILKRDCKKLQRTKFLTIEDWTKAVQEHTKTRNAYKLLVEIAKEPKKYLYSGKDLIYSDFNLYNNLLPIMEMRFDRSGKHLLVRLSERIAHHVNYESRFDSNGVWVYDSRSGNYDTNAESIIKMSKVVELWNDDEMKAGLKNVFLPATAFAVDLYKKER